MVYGPRSSVKKALRIIFLILLSSNAMRLLSLLLLFCLWSACCTDSCDCADTCKKPYVFNFILGPDDYTVDDIDTLEIRYKFEGIRNFDTTWFYLNSGKYQPVHPCAGNSQLVLDKTIPDEFGKLVRVETYQIFTAVDSFRIDGMDLIVTKSGEKCCRCVSGVRREFLLDSVEVVQTSLVPISVPIVRKK